jgi:hypothetical protein
MLQGLVPARVDAYGTLEEMTTMIYQVPGANGPLILILIRTDTRHGYIDSWCADPSEGGFWSAFSFAGKAQGSPGAALRFSTSNMVCHRVTD